MKTSFWFLALAFMVFGCKSQQQLESKLSPGDIIFQTLDSDLSKAISLATHSEYSHVGMVYKNQKGNWMVIEAVQPVQAIPLKKWIERGIKGHYVVKRLQNAETAITFETAERMIAVGRKMLGKNYDIYFEWSDERIYCSELVWKIYKQGAGIEIGTATQLKNFDLSHPLVKQKLKEHYGNNIPMNEMVVSPQSIFESDKLILVTQN